jgi:large subunit ribosomal protein L5
MRLKELYKKKIAQKLKADFNYKNQFLIPTINKVVVNVGFGARFKEKEFVSHVEESLKKITGQKPKLNPAKKSVSAFKIRQGNIIGASVILRGQRMYDFVEKLVNITFPRVRDFRGISSKNVDRTGNLTVGFKEQVAFVEIGVEDIDKLFGLEISIHSSAKNKEEGLALFRELGFPFKKDEDIKKL